MEMTSIAIDKRISDIIRQYDSLLWDIGAETAKKQEELLEKDNTNNRELGLAIIKSNVQLMFLVDFMTNGRDFIREIRQVDPVALRLFEKLVKAADNTKDAIEKAKGEYAIVRDSK